MNVHMNVQNKIHVLIKMFPYFLNLHKLCSHIMINFEWFVETIERLDFKK